MKEILEKLKAPMPYKWRIGQTNGAKTKCTVLAYIDARDAMDRLDEVVGPGNWSRDYKVVKDNLYCGVSIKFGDEWVTKWDCGTESNMEAEKGESSDAFKRACVNWGIGRFLYDMDTPWFDFDSNAKRLKDENGKVVWDITAYVNDFRSKKGKVAKAPAAETKPEKKAVEAKKEPVVDNPFDAEIKELSPAFRDAMAKLSEEVRNEARKKATDFHSKNKFAELVEHMKTIIADAANL